MTCPTRRSITVVGVGADGCAGLTAHAQNAVMTAQFLVGSNEQHALFPQFQGQRLSLKRPITANLAELHKQSLEHNICILASGDPLFFGIGSLLLRHFPQTDVAFIPQPSSVQWACARLGIPWADATLLSAHGRNLQGLAAQLRQSTRAAILTDPGAHSGPRIAAHLLAHGVTCFKAHLCEHLGSPDERIRALTLQELAETTDVADIHLLVLERSDSPLPPSLPSLPEAAFEHATPLRGLITKREVRVLTLAALRLRPTGVFWDVGAASGSVAIEAALLCPKSQVFAVERHSERAAQCHTNIRALGADNVHVVQGAAPHACVDLPAPDAVFVGGSNGNLAAICKQAFEALRPTGRLVVNTITLENTVEAQRVLSDLAGPPEATLVQLARAQAVGTLQRWSALNPVHIFAVTKPSHPLQHGADHAHL